MRLVDPWQDVSKALRLPSTPRMVQPLRSPGRGRPAGPVTGAVRRNQPANSAIPTASKSGRRIL